MALSGRKPKPDGLKRNRMPPTHEWTLIPDVAFEDAPPLGAVGGKATKRWWEVISRMPHCVLWTESDWQFAIDTARVHAKFIAGKPGTATELRNREKLLGVTMDSRRDLRIRYVPAEPKVGEIEEERDVVSLADYRASI
jgi:hypothetical protein